MYETSDGLATGMLLGQDSGRNNGWNNGADWIWLIILFAFFGWGGFGGGFGGWGNGGGSMLSGALTRGDLCQDMNFNDLQNGVRNVNDAVSLGFSNLNSTICHQQYDTASLLNSMNISNLQSANALQSQLAQCCCDTQRAIDGVNYNMATNTCALQNSIATSTRDIIQSQQCGTQRILDYLCQEKISGLQAQLASAEATISQQAQSQYIISQLRPFPTASYVVPNPFTGSYGFAGYGYGGACGCSSL